MSNTRKIASVAFTGAAVAGVTGLAAAPALAAAVTYHVTNNGVNIAAGAAFAATNVGNTTLKDVTHSATIVCKKATAGGTLVGPSPTGSLPIKLATLTASKTTWASCTVNGVGATAKLKKNTSLFGSKATVPNNITSGVTSGFIGAAAGGRSTISASITAANGVCKVGVVNIAGKTVPGTYHNASHELKIPAPAASKAPLSLKTVTGICGTLAVGDHAYFSGIYKAATPSKLDVTGG